MDVTDRACFDMLSCTDESFAVRDDDCEFVCEPISVLEYNGQFFYSVLDEIADEAKRLLGKEKMPFSASAVEKMRRLSQKALAKRGMELSKHTSLINRYEIRGCPPSKGEAKRLEGAEKNICFSDIAYLVSRGPVFGIFQGENVVSLCGAATFSDIAEIYTETAPAFRGCGFAKQCLAALCGELEKEGLFKVYECREENEASNRLAKGAGGILKMRYMRFIGRR